MVAKPACLCWPRARLTSRGPWSMCETTGRSAVRARRPCFRYSRNRSGDHPVEHLRGFAGILQADAYAGYKRLYVPSWSPAPVHRRAACPRELGRWIAYEAINWYNCHRGKGHQMTNSEIPVKTIDGRARTVRELLDKAKYAIDFYQREYAWHERQVRELIDDLTGKFLDSYRCSSTMSPAIPSPGFAGPTVPPRKSHNNSPLSTSRSVPGPWPASSATSAIGSASTTSACRPAPARTVTSSSPTSPRNARNSPAAVCRSSASIPKSASWSTTSRAKAAPGDNRHKPSTTTTSAPRLTASPSPTVSTTSPPTVASSSSAPPRHSRLRC